MNDAGFPARLASNLQQKLLGGAVRRVNCFLTLTCMNFNSEQTSLKFLDLTTGKGVKLCFFGSCSGSRD